MVLDLCAIYLVLCYVILVKGVPATFAPTASHSPVDPAPIHSPVDPEPILFWDEVRHGNVGVDGWSSLSDPRRQVLYPQGSVHRCHGVGLGRETRMGMMFQVVNWCLAGRGSRPIGADARRLLEDAALNYGQRGWEVFVRHMIKLVRGIYNREDPVRHGTQLVNNALYEAWRRGDYFDRHADTSRTTRMR